MREINYFILILFCGFFVSLSSCEVIKKIEPIIIPSTTFNAYDDKGPIENSELDEASGLVYSNNNPGYLWSFNDSGNPNKIFLLDSNGKGLINYTLNGSPNRDWEAISIFKDSNGNSSLFVAEIGDNYAQFNSYFLYWFNEPKVEFTGTSNRTLDNVSKLEFTLSDGSKRDMETILIDQKTKDVYIISKREDLKKLYMISADKLVNGNVTKAEFVKDLDFSNPFSSNEAVKTYFYVTDGNVSPDNTEILIRNYGEIYYWKRETNETIPQALSRQAKVVPSRTKYSSLDQQGEAQGEGVSFSTSADGYYSISENSDGNPSHLYFFKRK